MCFNGWGLHFDEAQGAARPCMNVIDAQQVNTWLPAGAIEGQPSRVEGFVGHNGLAEQVKNGETQGFFAVFVKTDGQKIGRWIGKSFNAPCLDVQIVCGHCGTQIRLVKPLGQFVFGGAKGQYDGFANGIEVTAVVAGSIFAAAADDFGTAFEVLGKTWDGQGKASKKKE